MKIELISERKLSEDEIVFLAQQHRWKISRRSAIRALGAGTIFCATPTLLTWPMSEAEAGALSNLARYMFKTSLRLNKTVVPISQEIRGWATLINQGEEAQQQLLIARLLARDGSEEDEAEKAIVFDPDVERTYRLASKATELGRKTVKWITDDDTTDAGVQIVEA